MLSEVYNLCNARFLKDGLVDLLIHIINCLVCFWFCIFDTRVPIYLSSSMHRKAHRFSSTRNRLPIGLSSFFADCNSGYSYRRPDVSTLPLLHRTKLLSVSLSISHFRYVIWRHQMFFLSRTWQFSVDIEICRWVASNFMDRSLHGKS